MITPTDPDLAKLAQLGLQTLGLYTGVIDGEWGPLSQMAALTGVEWDRYSAAPTAVEKLSETQSISIKSFVGIWTTHINTYREVAARTGIPAELVAAIHYREGSGDFTTYLQNGDPLGRPTTHDPKGILFSDWVQAAVAALTAEKSALALSAVLSHPTVLAARLSYAESYNGRGYFREGVPSPYVWAGTDGYRSGKFTSDDVYSPDAVDEQPGVLVLMRACVATSPV